MKTNQKSNANLRTFYIRHACIGVGCYPVSGVILQLTLMGRGVSAAQIAAITSTMSAVQMAMILFSSLLADHVRSVRRISALCVGGMSVFALCVLPFAGRTDMDAAAIAGIYLAAGCAYQLIDGLYTVLEYKLPYQIINMRDYGRVTSIQGLVNGVLLIGVSSLCMAFIARWGSAG